MSNLSDPRVFFAAERTLLAWLRTGIAVIGLGFLVAKFGLFLQVIQHPNRAPIVHLGSTVIGVGLVILGAAMVALATIQHSRFCRSLTPAEYPPKYNMTFSLWASGAVACSGGALAVYLAFL